MNDSLIYCKMSLRYPGKPLIAKAKPNWPRKKLCKKTIGSILLKNL